jgi:hypothetical protein
VSRRGCRYLPLGHPTGRRLEFALAIDIESALRAIDCKEQNPDVNSGQDQALFLVEAAHNP